MLDERFLVLYGDSWLQVDPAAVYAAALESGLPALMTVFENNGRWDASNVVYADGRVVRYEKGLDPRPAGDALDRLRPVGRSTRDLVAERVPADTGRRPVRALPHRSRRRGRWPATRCADRFYEIGSPEGLAEVTELLERSQG